MAASQTSARSRRGNDPFDVVDESTPLFESDYSGLSTEIPERIELGRLYGRIEQTKVAALAAAVATNTVFFTKRADKHKWAICCKSVQTLAKNPQAQAGRCPWTIELVPCGGKQWKVVAWVSRHTCLAYGRDFKAPINDMRLLMPFVKQYLVENEDATAEMVGNYVKALAGVAPKSHQAWRALDEARRGLWGSYEETFWRIPGYLALIKAADPKAVVKVETWPNGIFRRVFVCLSGGLQMLKNNPPCPHFDGCHAKEGFKHTVLAGLARDVEHVIFPVCFASVEQESKDNWTWCFNSFKEACREFGSGVVAIISDRDKGLKEAFKTSFPTTHHFFCLQHMKRNITDANNNDKEAGNFFWAMATVSGKQRFGEYKKKCLRSWPKIHEYLFGNNKEGYKYKDPCCPLEQWARAYSPVPRYGAMTSNNAESFNKANLKVRHKPVGPALHGLVQHTIKVCFERWCAARDMDTTFTTTSHKYMQTQAAEARGHVEKQTVLSRLLMGSVEVRDPESGKVLTYVCDVETRHCSCGMFWDHLFPCVHAAAVLFKTNEQLPEGEQQPLSTLVGKVYTTALYKEAYARNMTPVDPRDADPEAGVCGAPPREALFGRRVIKRIQSKGDPKGAGTDPSRGGAEGARVNADGEKLRKLHECSNCRTVSHNSATCPNPPNAEQAEGHFLSRTDRVAARRGGRRDWEEEEWQEGPGTDGEPELQPVAPGQRTRLSQPTVRTEAEQQQHEELLVQKAEQDRLNAEAGAESLRARRAREAERKAAAEAAKEAAKAQKAAEKKEKANQKRLADKAAKKVATQRQREAEEKAAEARGKAILAEKEATAAASKDKDVEPRWAMGSGHPSPLRPAQSPLLEALEGLQGESGEESGSDEVVDPVRPAKRAKQPVRRATKTAPKPSFVDHFGQDNGAGGLLTPLGSSMGLNPGPSLATRGLGSQGTALGGPDLSALPSGYESLTEGQGRMWPAPGEIFF